MLQLQNFWVFTFWSSNGRVNFPGVLRSWDPRVSRGAGSKTGSHLTTMSKSNLTQTWYLMFPFQFLKASYLDRSSSLQMFFKIGVLKKRLQHRCFPANTAKFLRATFFIEHLRWLLLSSAAKICSKCYIDETIQVLIEVFTENDL